MTLSSWTRWLAFLVVLAAAQGVSIAAQPKDTDKGFVLFDVGKAGASASIDVHVSWLSEKYARELAFMTKPPPGGWYLADGTDIGPKYDDLMESLTGFRSLGVIPYRGQKPKAHKGVQLHVVWIKKESGKILQEETVFIDKTRSHIPKIGFGDAFFLSSLALPRGDYVATVTALKDDPRFTGLFRTGLVAGSTFSLK